MRKSILLFVIYFITSVMHSQSTTKVEIDSVYDQYGKKHALQNLLVNVDGKYGTHNVINSTYTCTAGYFNVFFAANCGMDGPGPIDQQRRSLVCEALSNISGMVNPSFTLAADRVNILVDDISLYVPGASTLATLGVFSPFMAFPQNPINAYPGIVDNLIYKTITSQQNAYNGIAIPPYVVSGSSSANFYHGMMAINFLNPIFNFNTNISNLPAWNQVDLYTVVLHEIVHGLGFISNINADGYSIFGAPNNYYSRYDRFLKDKFGNNLLTPNANPCSSQYGLAFTSNTLNLSPNCPNPNSFLQNNTTCTTAVYYSSSSLPHIPVYTPDCYTTGSSLSHFEDQCYPLVGPVYGNDLYFTLSNGTTWGLGKRHLQEEERLVLCDLGYNVISTFTSNANSAPKTYTSGNCSGINVAGINDGMVPTLFGPTYTINTNIFTPITINNIIGNDINTISYKCLQPYIGTGTVSNTSGTGSFNYTPFSSGLHLLRYIPVGANNVEGGITYIYVKVSIPTGTCNAPAVNPCNLVYNGDFELFNVMPITTNTSGLGPFPCGWSNACGTPDYFTSLSIPGSACGVPCNTFGYETDNIPGHYAYMGGMCNPTSSTTVNSECIYTQLTNSLAPNTAYSISFDVSLADGYSSLASMLQVYLAPNSSFVTNGFAGITAVPGSILLTTTNTFSQTNGWTNVTITFTTGSTAGQKYLALGALFGGIPNNTITPGPLNSGGCWFSSIQGATWAYYYYDNIKLFPAAYNATLSLPPTICTNQTLNLNPTALPSGGIFTGNGVVCNGTNCYFDANIAGLGNSLISYSVSIPSATCPYIASASILVNPTITLVPSIVTNICAPGQTAVLTVSNTQNVSSTYTWQPGNVVGQTVSVTPSANTIYTVIGSNGLCTSSQTIALNIISGISFVNPPTALCDGLDQSHWIDLTALLSPGTPTNGVWTSISPPQANTGLWLVNSTGNGSGGHAYVYGNYMAYPGTYTINYVYNLPPFCNISGQFTLNVLNTPTVIPNTPISQCINIPGYSSTLIASSTSTLPMTYTWSPMMIISPSVIVSPTAATIYTIVGSDGTCTSGLAYAEVRTNSLCCGSNTSVTNFQYVSSSSLGSATLSGLYGINQNVTITGTVSLDGEFYMAPNVSIYVANGGYLNTKATYTSTDGPRSAKVHMLSCNDMWNGIIVNPGGRVELEDKDLIEDANTAVSSNASPNVSTNPLLYEIFLHNVVFNKNNIGVAIKNYTQTNSASPFEIMDCVFSCRTLTYTSYYNISAPLVPSWPDAAGLRAITSSTNPLAPPSNLMGFSPANLKSPMNTLPSLAGVWVENSGRTVGPLNTNPSYYGIIIGDRNYNGWGLNLFDNLNTGIYSVNSNVYSYKNMFQNSRMTNSTLVGAGIRAINDNTNPLNYNSSLSLVTPSTPTLNMNTFYDCHRGIEATNLFQLDAQYCEFRTTQSKLVNSATAFQGVFIIGNKYKNYLINYNKFLNIKVGVALIAVSGNYNLTGSMAYGQVWGTVNIKNNYFSPVSSPTVSLGNNYMNDAIIVENSLYAKGIPAQLGVGFYTVVPNNGLWIQNNTIDRVYRGVWALNFSNSYFGKFTANNTISLRQDHVSTNTQWGVRYDHNYAGVVNSNTITGFTTSTATPLSGISYSLNTNGSIQCNTTYSLPVGMAFGGLNGSTIWRANIMQAPHARGMSLSNSGIIGQQGTASVPSDNYWQGTWSSNLCTWTFSSTASNSKIYRRTSPIGYNPLYNSGIPVSQSYAGGGALFNSNNSAGYPPCAPIAKQNSGGNPPKSNLYSAMVSGSVNYLSNPSETNEINRMMIYRDLDQDTAFKSSDTVLVNFYQTNQSTDVGILTQIEQNLSDGDFTSASGLLSSYTPGSTIQSNYKQFYQLYVSYATVGFLGLDDKANLDALAHKCPYTDGAVVFSARVLFSLLNNNFDPYNDSGCESAGGQGGRYINSIPDKANTGEQGLNYLLFPNPAVDILHIIGSNETEELTVSISDVNNKLLSKQSLGVVNYHSELKLNLLNGVYFVTLENKDHVRVTKKLVISK